MTEVMQIEQTCSADNLSVGTAEEAGQSPTGPMVLTVNQGGPPILKLVSPVDGGAPQLIKVVPAVVADDKGPTDAVVSQRVYSIVQKSQGGPAAKQGFNNGQQRIHTIGALPHKPGGPQKVQILSNVILSNKNLVNVSKTLQTQRQGPQAPGRPKTIKTLSPQSYAKPGLKTLGPQMNNYTKMVPVQRGIKTLAPQRAPKPNYIGKHAAQAQRKPQLGPKRPKNLPTSRPEIAKPISPTEDTLSEDIGEEIKPDFSPNLSYLYQVVMLDHNYGAPPPALSPLRNPGAHQNSASLNGALANNRDRETNFSNKRRLNSAGHDDDAASTISSEGGVPDDGEEGEETETAPEGEGDEDGITRCICDFDHDDGYMICCDVCSSWQHVDCMGLDRDHIPDKYSCVRCAPRRVDRAHARALQQRKREEFARLGPPAGLAPPQGGPEPPTRDDSSSDSDSSGLNNNLPKKRSAVSGGRRRSEPPRRPVPATRSRPPRRESAPARRSALKKREKKVVAAKRKLKPRSSVDESSQESWGPAGQAAPQTAGPAAALSPNLVQLRQWIEKYEEAVTNHYSPELRARMARQNGALEGAREAPGSAAEEARTGERCRVATQALTGLRLLVAAQSLVSGAPVAELRGKYMLGAQHRAPSAPRQRPGPFLFFYRLDATATEVCVDTRTYGNDARFIRRSCRPNAELRHRVEKGALHLYICTTQPVDKNQELTLRHETHDLAAAALGPSSVSCACGGPPGCLLGQGAPGGEEEGRRRRQQRRAPPLPSPPAAGPPSPTVEPDEDTEESPESAPPPALSTRRATQRAEPHSPPQPAAGPPPAPTGPKDKKRKLTREERKMEAIMKAFERLEKQEQRKQEVQARQALRPTAPEPPPPAPEPPTPEQRRRKKRKGRARSSRRLRLNSTDSAATSGEESLQSPGGAPAEPEHAAGLLLALAAGQSSPETPPPLSSACLLVAAAVGPLEPGFKFPKTKKVLMNEWLNKEDDAPTPKGGLQSLVQAAGLCESPRGLGGSAKKRWLRQAIEECESPPAGPPKKRRLARESLSSEQGFTPPSTPLGPAPDHDEEFYPPDQLPAPPRPSPLFRDSAQLLGTVEKSIRFYEESLGGGVPQGPEPGPPEPEPEPEPPTDEEEEEQQPASPAEPPLPEPVEPPPPEPTEPPLTQEPAESALPDLVEPPLESEPERDTTPVPRTPSPEPPQEDPPQESALPEPTDITPAKRKLSISEYRKRKQLRAPNNPSSPPPLDTDSPPLCASPTLIGSAAARRSRSASSSSATSSLSSDEELLIGQPAAIETTTELSSKSERPNTETTVTVAFNSAPTAVERQRENVERLKKVFGLSVDDESRKTNPIIREKEPPVEQPPPPEAGPPKDFSPKFEEPSFIPPFNNPVYPNSAQFTGFPSVIDSALYEGRNPSPPPPKLLTSP